MEDRIVNGVEFRLQLRRFSVDSRPFWAMWVRVRDAESLHGNSVTFSGTSDTEVRQRAEQWMLSYKPVLGL